MLAQTVYNNGYTSVMKNDTITFTLELCIKQA